MRYPGNMLNKIKGRFRKVLTLALFLVLVLTLALTFPSSVDACAWYAGADGTTNTGSDGPGKGPGDGDGGCEESVANPVTVASGRCIESETDVFVAAPGIPVVMKRSFNNLDLRVSSIGWGWRFSLDMRVIFVNNQADDLTGGITHAVVINPNGRRDTYTKGTGDTFDPPESCFCNALLTLNPDGTAILTKDNLTYTFNQGGRLTETKALNNNTLTINYTDTSSTAEITTVVDSVGRTYSFTYENNKIKTITDPAARQAIYTYNGGLLTEVTNPLNETTTYSYDPSTYDLLTKTSPKGDTYVTNTYDSQGRVLTQTLAGKLYEFTYYDGYTDVTEQGQNTSTYYYNTTFGFITKIVDPFTKETIYDWDITTQELMSVTDPLGNVTRYTYTSIASGDTTDDDIKTVTVEDSVGTIVKSTTFDYYGLEYENKLRTITDGEGNVTTYTYTNDGKANLYSVEDYMGNTTYYEEYNSRGQVTKIKDANGKYTNITYDQYGYIDSITDPLNRTTYYTLDIVGNKTQVKDALNRTTDYIYQNYTRLTDIIDALNGTTSYEYDLNSNIIKVTDAKLHNTHFEYNSINKLTAIKDHFLNIKASYLYDNRLNLAQTTNARGETIDYTYDALNRVKTKTLNGAYGADIVNYTYDDAGRLIGLDNTSADLTLAYDEAHRLTSVTTGGAMPGTTISYTYDGNDNRLTMTDAMGTTNYTPDVLNRLETLVSPNMGTFSFSYDNLGRRTGMTMGNGITATYNYDDASQLTGISFKDGAIPVTSNDYIYDLVGNRKTEVDLAGTHDYNYDELYRLTSATHPVDNPAESFNYDPVGNRTDSHLSSSYITNDLNRVTEDDSYLYDYDADGNLISKTLTSTSASTFYYYDAENKLVIVDQYDEFSTLISTSNYSYDGFGNRVKKDVDGTVTYYIYDHEDIRFETDENGTIIAEYTHGPRIDEPLAMRREGLPASGWENYYYHVNGLGTVTALTDSSKTMVQSYVYDSFGQIISQTGSIQNPFTYTAREYDEETGLYYYRVRYYDANVGRFISEDPIGINGGINLYAYVGNNPVNYVDPCGSGIIKWCITRITNYFLGKIFDSDLEDPAERDDDGDGTPNFKDPDSPLCIVNCEPTAPTPEPPTPEPPAPGARCQRAK